MIQVQNIQKKIDKHFRLGPIDLHITPGTVTALIGNNGAGKSTLLRLLTGMVYEDEGTIIRFGYADEHRQWKEQIGYVPQTILGYERFTLKQLAELHQIGYEKWDQGKFRSIAERFGLPLNKRVDALSTGLQKQALVLLALARQTKVLIMDEPFSGVDIEGQEKMKKEWVYYLEEDPERAILFATHVPDEVKQSADYIVCMKEGILTGTYEKDELQQNYGRLWITGKDRTVQHFSESLQHNPQVLVVKDHGPQWEVLTRDVQTTEQSLQREGYQVVMRERLAFSEILRFLLADKKSE